MCNAVAPFISCILTSVPARINNSTILTCLHPDAKKDNYCFLLIFIFYLKQTFV